MFDARSETDPFAGVRHWVRALKQARQTARGDGRTAPRLLVASRMDSGGVAVGKSRLAALIKDMGFAGFAETSSKEEWGIRELDETIRKTINWDALPNISSNDLFQSIKDYLIQEKQVGRLLSTTGDLYRGFVLADGRGDSDLRLEFDTCVRLLESRGLIRRLSFGDLVLLQPELLDAYASSLIAAAREEPDGMGIVAEVDAKHGSFRLLDSERIADPHQEELLLIAAVEDLVRHEIALREEAENGTFLVFPSELRRDNIEWHERERIEVSVRFSGAVFNIYATLIVRLTHSLVFKRTDMWMSAAAFAAVKGICGLSFKELEEGVGELSLFFDDNASVETKLQCVEYIKRHVERNALHGSVGVIQLFSCSECGTAFTSDQVSKRRERGFKAIRCNVCQAETSLVTYTEVVEQQIAERTVSVVKSMDVAADEGREVQTAAVVLAGKKATCDYDVFLCHNNVDKPAVKRIGEGLLERGVLPWLDEWELRPGISWQRALEAQIAHIKAAAVFVGPNGIGPWQHEEIEAFIREFIRRGCPVIPVLLPKPERRRRRKVDEEEVDQSVELPLLLRGRAWVDFRRKRDHAFNQLIWGISGVKRAS